MRSASARSAIVGVCLVTLLVSATGASATPASALASAPAAGLLAYRATANGGHDIAVVSPDGSGGRIVIATPDNESQPTWSPDGTRVAFEANYDGDFDIWGMTADGTLERLAGGGTDDGVNETQPTWSPSGDAVAYTSNASGDFEIMVTSLVDGSSLDVSQGPGRDAAPAWSPSGDLIAFGSDRTGSTDVWVVRADGSDLADLTARSSGNELQPAWSPSGSSLAFISNQGSGPHVWTMDADGGHRVQLTSAAGGDASPDWSPDGTQIVFQRQTTSASTRLWIVEATGADERWVPGVVDAARPDWQSVAAASGPLPPTSTIEVPVDGAILGPQELDAISGTASDDAGVVRVEIALRAKKPDGSCDWWVAPGFVPGPCQARVWHDATGLDAWTIPVEPLPSTGSERPYRYYTVFSRATDAIWNVDDGDVRGTNRVGFNVSP